MLNMATDLIMLENYKFFPPWQFEYSLTHFKEISRVLILIVKMSCKNNLSHIFLLSLNYLENVWAACK
jgi:hypothetical protein